MRLSGRSGSMAKKAISGYDVHTANIPLERFFLSLFFFSSRLFSPLLFLVTRCIWVLFDFSTVSSPGLLGWVISSMNSLFACGVFVMYTYIGNIHERGPVDGFLDGRYHSSLFVFGFGDEELVVLGASFE